MKKTVALLLALALLLGLAACASPLPTPSTAPETKAPETKAPETEAPETEAPETEAPETEAPATEAPEADLTKGVVEGSVYTNESMNLRFEAPAGWHFYDEEQIAEANNMTAEMFEDTDVADAVAAAGQYMDLFAASATGLDNVNLIIQPNQPMLNLLTDRQIFETLEQNYRSQFASAGMEVKGYEVIEANFCGEEKTLLHLEMSMNGLTLSEYQVWVRSNPDYIGVLTISALNMDDPQSLLDCFSKLQ